MNDFLEQISSLSPQRLALLAVKLKEQLDSARRINDEPIAVIGIGCRFPGASDPAAFWDLLSNGREGIRGVPAARWPIDEYFDPDPDALGMMSARAGGFLDEIDKFDPAFFGIAPREALTMDPQQRLVLEVAWEALENAGLAPTSLVGSRTGVYLGICATDYLHLLLSQGVKSIDSYLASGNALSIGAGRLSYVLGLQGPCMAIDTSCSASLVSIHSACQSLRLGESSLALAGGVNLICAPDVSIALSRSHMLAADARCKTFDAAADGFTRGEGCGIVVLKRLADAKRDGDRILALIRGSAINQDGKSGGLTVPNGPAQESVIRDALTAAGLQGSDIDYVEAHGTGTSLGDPIEVRSLGRALGEGRSADRPLLIGSVKTNIGHLESAAGVAGFIKVVLALQNDTIPRHLNFKTPNPFIEWADLPVAVTSDGKSWARSNRRRLAGVSSFGFSGTNAHVILEEAPAAEIEPSEAVDRPLHCLTVSARSEASLQALADRYANALASEDSPGFADFAYVAATGRAHLTHRLAVVASDGAEARAALLAANAGQPDPKVRRGKLTSGQSTEVVFLYTGAGAQYPGMGRELYRTSPVFRDAIDHCDRLLGPDGKGRTLKSVLWEEAEGEPAIHEIGWTQPAMFAIEYALTALWRSWGVTPAAVIGHSVGEYAAACAAGVFSLEDGLRLIAERGRIMQSLPPGGLMAALYAPIRDIEMAIAPVSDRVAIAAVNGPGSVVISGEAFAVESVLAEFAKRNIIGQRLFVSLAAHSPLMEPALDRMESAAQSIPMLPPSIPICWNLTGRPLPGGTAPDAQYWRRHMREPVRFADGIKTLHDDGFRIFLEVGPHPTLLAFARDSLPEDGSLLLPSLRRGKEDWNELLTSLADLHVRGVPVDFAGFDRSYSRRRITIPTYAFDRQRYWAPPTPSARAGLTKNSEYATETVQQASGLHYKLAWEPSTSGRPNLQRPSDLRDGAFSKFDELAAHNDFAVYARSRPELDRLTIQFICKAFLELGFDATPGRRFDAGAERSKLRVVQKYSHLFDALIALLAQHGVFSVSGSEYVVRALSTDEPAEGADQLLGRFGEIGAEISILRRCGTELSRVLTGEQDPLRLLFDEAGLEHVQKLYADSPFSRTFNGTLADILCRVKAAAGKRPLRILEIGAGTGGTTRYVLPAIGEDAEYTFTDISPLFLSQAKENFGNFPGMRVALLDVERSPSEQGFQTGAYDIVIASNAIHATADIKKSMSHVFDLLAPTGLFFAIEGLRPESWINITFGLSDGWWRSTDQTRRPNGPLLNGVGWRQLLNEVGFSDVILASDDRQNELAARQAVIVANRAQKHRQWVVLADRNGLGLALAPALAASGDTVTVVDSRDWRAMIETSDQIEEGTAWRTDKDRFKRENASEPGAGIIYLGALDGEEGGGGHPNPANLEILKYAARVNEGKLWLVTKGAMDVRGPEDVTSPEQAALWGLGRTFARENPSVWGGLLDLDPNGDMTDAVDAVLDAIRADDGEDQVVWRDGSRRVARLIPDAAPVPARPFSVRADRSYLVTGGLGGIGLQVAVWLAEKGAQHLVLVGRTPLSKAPSSRQGDDPRAASITMLEKKGVTVSTVALDVSDAAAMEQMMSRFGKEWPPLGGIVHAAVALTTHPVAKMPLDDFTAMMRTKVAGAKLLYKFSESQPVEFFVNFSSIAALLGQVHYAHYAAANAVQDALACVWSANGARAYSVNWGTWEQMHSLRQEDRDGLAKAGFRPLSAATALDLLGEIIVGDIPRVTVADIDRVVLREVYESRGAGPILSNLTVQGGEAVERDNENAAPKNVVLDLLSLPPSDRLSAIESQTRAVVARILGISDPDSISPAQSLFELGLDSLMAIELRRKLGEIAGTALPSALAFNYPKLSALIALIDETVGARAQPSSEAQVIGELLDRVDDLSGAELDSLLAEMMDKESTA